jgi:site-specific DNA-methyltransferase (adenine-specific)
MSRFAIGGSDCWQTPPDLLERVRRIGPIGHDPCSSDANPVGACCWTAPPGDGLATNWRSTCGATELTYVNPPYSQAAAWAAKVAEEAALGCEIVTLCAARPDTRWFARLVWDTAQAVCFIKGRLRFVGAPAPAPFPSAVTYHGPRPWRFEEAFADAGKVIRL